MSMIEDYVGTAMRLRTIVRSGRASTRAAAAPAPVASSGIETFNANAVLPGWSNSTLAAIAAVVVVAGYMWKRG